MKVPDRIAWTVALLDVAPDDRILELGCGPGVAVRLVGERLAGGRITAIDRSATAVERTRHRNGDLVAAGRAVVEQVALARFTGAADQFDKAFAVNVNAFWTGPAEAECTVLARVLRPGGRVLLVYEGPGADGGGHDVGPQVAATLAGHGFSPDIVRHPAGMVAITGRLPV